MDEPLTATIYDRDGATLILEGNIRLQKNTKKVK